ncbi:MAG TPA: MASE1 domain-containing protein [Thermoleophilaceae bacterium]
MPGSGLAHSTVSPVSHDLPRALSPGSLVKSSRARYLFAVIALAGLYWGAAELGYAIEFSGPVAAIVWLPVGVGITFLYLGGMSLWPGVVIGDLLANDYNTLPLGSALGQTVGNTLEVVVATLLMHRLVRRGSPLNSISGLAGMLIAIAVGTAVSATVGALSLQLGDVIPLSAAASTWRTWWLGDASGALIIVPLAIAWHRPPPREWWTGRRLELTLMLIAVAGLSELGLRTEQPLSYLVFPALIWAALRFGQRGATLAIAVATGFTVWETTHYVGPFVYDSITRSVLVTQLFIAVSAISTLCLAVVVSEREAFAEGLRASRARIVEAADTERRRLEHNLHDGAQQRLTALTVRLGLATERVLEHPEIARYVLADAEGELAIAIDELRDLAHGIHPTLLTQTGLANAIRDLAERSAVPVRLIQLPPTRVDDAAEATAYYVVAESLANAQKYSRASRVDIRAALTPGLLHILVADDGIGGADESAGTGLQGLRDRVEAIGGSFGVESSASAGTRIAAVIPATRLLS